MFTEGWVEFNDKRIAKAVVRSLNGQIIGKSNFQHFYLLVYCQWLADRGYSLKAEILL